MGLLKAGRDSNRSFYAGADNAGRIHARPSPGCDSNDTVAKFEHDQ
jgi:hypothetical protein